MGRGTAGTGWIAGQGQSRTLHAHLCFLYHAIMPASCMCAVQGSVEDRYAQQKAEEAEDEANKKAQVGVQLGSPDLLACRSYGGMASACTAASS